MDEWRGLAAGLKAQFTRKQDSIMAALENRAQRLSFVVFRGFRRGH